MLTTLLMHEFPGLLDRLRRAEEGGFLEAELDRSENDSLEVEVVDVDASQNSALCCCCFLAGRRLWRFFFLEAFGQALASSSTPFDRFFPWHAMRRLALASIVAQGAGGRGWHIMLSMCV